MPPKSTEAKLSPARRIAVCSLLAAVLALLGCFKIPGPIPGTEFQLSAPFAVCIAACFGFANYFKIGLLASLINFLLGTHTLVNITVAMVFRLVAGGLISLAGANPLTLLVSGPLGTGVGRLVLAAVLGVEPLPLLLASLPGMAYTALGSLLLYPVMRRLVQRIYGTLPNPQAAKEIIHYDNKTPDDNKTPAI